MLSTETLSISCDICPNRDARSDHTSVYFYAAVSLQFHYREVIWKDEVKHLLAELFEQSRVGKLRRNEGLERLGVVPLD
jgi:hypothetical protein